MGQQKSLFFGSLRLLIDILKLSLSALFFAGGHSKSTIEFGGTASVLQGVHGIDAALLVPFGCCCCCFFVVYVGFFEKYGPVRNTLAMD